MCNEIIINQVDLLSRKHSSFINTSYCFVTFFINSEKGCIIKKQNCIFDFALFFNFMVLRLSHKYWIKSTVRKKISQFNTSFFKKRTFFTDVFKLYISSFTNPTWECFEIAFSLSKTMKYFELVTSFKVTPVCVIIFMMIWYVMTHMTCLPFFAM